jgi:hypothetical protein
VLVRAFAVLVAAIAIVALVFAFLPASGPSGVPSLIPRDAAIYVAAPEPEKAEIAECQQQWVSTGGLSTRPHGFMTSVPPNRLTPFLLDARRLALAEFHHSSDSLIGTDLGRYLGACQALDLGAR